MKTMKTTVVLTIGCLLMTTTLFAQRASDDLMKQITKETCDELSRVDVAKQTTDELKISLGFALVKVMGQHQADLKLVGISTTDSKSVEKLAVDVGMRLVADCPTFFETLTKNPNHIKELAQNEPSGTISGKLVRIVGGDFTHLLIEDAKGKIERLWWMEYFNGSNSLLGRAESQLNRPVRVSYVEREMFNSTLNDYVKVKVITRID